MKLNPITLEQYAAAINVELDVSKLRDAEGKAQGVMVSFKRAETREVGKFGILTGVSGRGATEHQAKRDYAQRLNGKVLVLDSMRNTRREFTIPQGFLK